MEIKEYVGLKIRTRMKEKGLKQSDLSALSNLSDATVSKAISGKLNTLDTIEKLCAPLGLKITLENASA